MGAEKGVQIRKQIRQTAGEGRQVRVRQPTEGQGQVDYGCLKKTCWLQLSPIVHPPAACPLDRPNACLTTCLPDRPPSSNGCIILLFRLTGNRADKPPVLPTLNESLLHF